MARILPLRSLWLLAAVLVGTSGCLPYACNRTESRALFPADSLSRSIAESVAIDTLIAQPGWVLPGLRYPRTVQFGSDGTFFVADTEQHVLYAVNSDSTRRIPVPNLRYPYLAGERDGLPVLFSPEARRLAAVRGDTEVWSIPTPGDVPGARALQYARVDGRGAWFKGLAEDFDGYIVRLDSAGTPLERHELPGAYWSYAGMLRLWQGRLTSLAGYRPSMDVIGEDGHMRPVRLVGFDSPMLARTRRFALGEADDPPLLSASAAGLDSLLFVLNMRPGWLRVDVYDADARLESVLVEPDPAFGKEFYPSDLAVRRISEHVVELAVAIVHPEPSVRRYRWIRQP